MIGNTKKVKSLLFKHSRFITSCLINMKDKEKYLFFNYTIQRERNKFILCLSINDDLYPYLSILFLSENENKHIKVLILARNIVEFVFIFIKEF